MAAVVHDYELITSGYGQGNAGQCEAVHKHTPGLVRSCLVARSGLTLDTFRSTSSAQHLLLDAFCSTSSAQHLPHACTGPHSISRHRRQRMSSLARRATQRRRLAAAAGRPWARRLCATPCASCRCSGAPRSRPMHAPCSSRPPQRMRALPRSARALEEALAEPPARLPFLSRLPAHRSR